MTQNKIILAMLLFVPITIGAELLKSGHLIVFILSIFAIIPLAALIAKTTESIAEVIGPSLGGLLNATFGNLTEMVVSIVALKAGLVEVVKASILGSIIGNLLLALGLAMFLGGIRFNEQTFSTQIARMNASSLLLAVLVLLTPSAIQLTSHGIAEIRLQHFSYAASLLLLIFYGLNLFFANKNYRAAEELHILEGTETEVHHSVNIPKQIGILLGLTLVLVIISEILVGSLEETVKVLHFTELFTGTFLLPLFSGVVEYITCVSAARKNQMDLSLSVAIGSTLQIALFVTPVLVLIGFFLNVPLTLEFNTFGMFAAVSAVAIITSISSDGNSNWLEGILLLIFYVVLGVAFYIHP